MRNKRIATRACVVEHHALQRLTTLLLAPALGYAEVLGLGLEDVRALMLKEPGLLSYTVGTLKCKLAYITQVS